MRKKKIAVVMLVIMVVVVCVVGFINFWWISGYPYIVDDEIEFHVEKNDGNYTIKIKNINKGTIHMSWEITSFKADVWTGEAWNTSNWNPSNLLISVKVENILNNETSNITFYDKDNDGEISVGDEFVIKGILAEKGNCLIIYGSGGGQHGAKFK